MNLQEARELAAKYLHEGERREGFTPMIADDATLELPFGWGFFYNSAEYLRTGDFLYALAGNAPIVVSRCDGQIHETGTARPLAEYLARIAADINGGTDGSTA